VSKNLEKISSEIWFPFAKSFMSIEITTAEKTAYGHRKSGIRSRDYDATRYGAPMTVTAVELNLDWYFSIRHMDAKQQYGKAAFGRIKLGRFASALAEVEDQFAARAFTPSRRHEGRFVVTEDVEVILPDLFQNAGLKFMPIIWNQVPETGSQEPVGDQGVRLFINSEDLYGECSMEAFQSFRYYFERLDPESLAHQATAIAVAAMGGGADGTPLQAVAAQPKRGRT